MVFRGPLASLARDMLVDSRPGELKRAVEANEPAAPMTSSTSAVAPTPDDWRQVDWQRQARTVKVGRDDVSYVDLGEGDPVLAIHGLGGNWRVWLENLPSLAQPAAGDRGRSPRVRTFGTRWRRDRDSRIFASFSWDCSRNFDSSQRS